MKMKYNYLMIAAVAAAVVSCAKNESLNQDWQQFPAVEFTSTVGTKTIFTADGDAVNVKWKQNDTIGIYSSQMTGRGNYPYTAIVDKVDASKARFAAMSPDKMFRYDGKACSYYAYYPYSPAAGNSPVVRLSVPATQLQPVAGDLSNVAVNSVFVAEPAQVGVEGSSQADFSFKPVMPVVKLALQMAGSETIDVPVKSVKLVSSSSTALAGGATIDITQNNAKAQVSEGSNELSVVFPDMITLGRTAASDAYMVALPGSHGAGALRALVTAVDNSVATVDLPGVTFAQGMSYARSISLKVSDFKQGTPFDVTAASLTCNAGESLKFNIQGAANGISFYSGEKYHDYEYAEKDRVEALPSIMSFKHALSAGNQPNSLRVKVSSNFTGVMTESAIKSATWTDITDLFTICTVILGDKNPVTSDITTYNQYFVDSGAKDISSYFDAAGKLYIAFFWHADVFDAVLNNGRTVSYLTKLKVDGKYEMTQTNITFVVDSSFDACSLPASNRPAWMTPKTANGVPPDAAFRFMSDFRPTMAHDAWAVINEPVSSDAKNLGPDKPFVVQGAAEETPGSYSYCFETPGTYEVVFVADCPSLSGPKSEIRKFTVTVK